MSAQGLIRPPRAAVERSQAVGCWRRRASWPQWSGKRRWSGREPPVLEQQHFLPNFNTLAILDPELKAFGTTKGSEAPAAAAVVRPSGLDGDGLGRREEAVAIRRELAAQRPDAFRPDLATALSTLANRLSEVGRREEALAVVRELLALLA